MSGVGEGRELLASSRSRRAALTVVICAFLAFAVSPASASGASAFNAQGSVEQVYVTGVAANAQMSLLNSRGKTVSTKNPQGETVSTQNADSLGGLLFRKVEAGERLQGPPESTRAKSPNRSPFTLDASAPWDPSIYDQSIPDNGYTYLTTRDGTQLAIDVHPPNSPAGEPGCRRNSTFRRSRIEGVPTPSYTPPYPTLIEYSGYGYANPKGPENGIAVLANLMGFAVVDVNMRGTGCSGGAYDFFETLQNLDGYDVIETIAHQPWVLDHKVGMLGISYGGISQLFTAQTRPPDLEAIAPLSVLDATATTLYPGGILNTGFAVPWAEERQQNAEPAGPGHGQAWAYERIQEGDKTCAANQDLHGEATNLLEKDQRKRDLQPIGGRSAGPGHVRHNINVPTFMACQWEDEQTGGHCADLAEHFTGTKQKWFTFTNGAHIDSLDPYTYDRLYDFLELYVAHQAPIVNSAVVHAAAPVIYQEAMGLPKDRPGHASAGPDPGAADLRIGAGRLRSAPRDPGAVRQRRRHLADRQQRPPAIRIRASNRLVLRIPDPRHDGPVLVLRAERHAHRTAPGVEGRRLLHLERQRHAADRLLGQHRHRGACGATPPQWEWNWEQPPGGLGRVLRVGAAHRRHHRDRRRRGPPVGEVVHPERRLPGDGQRSPSRRQRDLRPGRLAAGERAQARHERRTTSSSRSPTLLQPIPTFLAKDDRTRCPRTASSRS